jgi:hypothetical protein
MVLQLIASAAKREFIALQIEVDLRVRRVLYAVVDQIFKDYAHQIEINLYNPVIQIDFYTIRFQKKKIGSIVQNVSQMVALFVYVAVTRGYVLDLNDLSCKQV